ncbi:MAG TPA: arylsulfatase [Cyclobacteriaceae bacterium]|nr:arylsulfatase [Cyclobacteriaceae bacterium]
MRVRRSYFLLLIVLAMGNCTSRQDSAPVRQPNIVFIVADDLGYGDIGCYGQKKFFTPNIDRLAAGGLRFTNHYAGAAVCAPSRSALLTGLHTGHTPIRGNKEVLPEGQWPLPSGTFNLALMLKEAGYVTGAFGKWGLGYPGSEGDPLKQGFDTFFGYNCQRLAHNYYPGHLWRDRDSVVMPGNVGLAKETYAPNVIHTEALKFMDANAARPFFLYYPSVLPHAELAAPEEYIGRYRGKLEPERSYKGVDEGKTFRDGPYGSQPETHATFAAMISLLDVQVGEIMTKLRELGLEENTIIIFTSDNGPHVEGGADPEYFDSNGILKGYKRDLYEGGIRVPMIVRWPERIAAGTRTDHVSAFWDVVPTIADIVAANVKQTDGISFLATLLGDSSRQVKHNFLYWEFHEKDGRRAVRRGNWKLVQYEVNKDTAGSFELYDLAIDPGEESDMAPEFPEVVEQLKSIMNREHRESAAFPYSRK